MYKSYFIHFCAIPQRFVLKVTFLLFYGLGQTVNDLWQSYHPHTQPSAQNVKLTAFIHNYMIQLFRLFHIV